MVEQEREGWEREREREYVRRRGEVEREEEGRRGGGGREGRFARGYIIQISEQKPYSTTCQLFREDREAVQSWDVCQASCLLLAYEEKLKMGGGSSVVRNSNSTEIQTNNALDDDDDGGGDFDGIVNSRLAWRNRMHTINDDEVGVATGSLRFADGSNEMEKKVSVRERRQNIKIPVLK